MHALHVTFCFHFKFNIEYFTQKNKNNNEIRYDFSNNIVFIMAYIVAMAPNYIVAMAYIYNGLYCRHGSGWQMLSRSPERYSVYAI